ncbi:MAG TPA: AMP-dependent synthetase [Syntrophus sp. (in: bacteria)]|jgi:acyl-CoA synthetase (AMP-forming)/AMP-acid ligase II|nr:AMP-dependent synthetase [Syntrophus sp. (in: bacteria)]
MDERMAMNMMRRVAYGDCLRRATLRYPTREAVVDGGRRITFAELNRRANQFANALMGRNFQKGTKIAFISLNALEHFVAFFGTAKAGMIFVPINPLFKTDELAFALNHADCEIVIFNGQMYPMFKDAFAKAEKAKVFIAFNPPTEGDFIAFDAFLGEGSDAEPEVFIEADDDLLILYTGGTTSYPRAAVLSHLNLFVCTNGILIDIPFTHQDKLFMVMPLFHIGAFIITSLVMFVGGAVHLYMLPDMKQILVNVEKEKITCTLLISPLWRQLLDHPDFGKHDLSSLRLCVYFTAVMPEDLLREVMDKVCPNLCLCFGQTEMSPSTTCFKPEDQLRKMKSLGNSTVNVEIAIMDDFGNLLPAGEAGEIVYRSPQVMKGYYKDEAENRRVFEHGWFHSGDVGCLDEENYVYFLDRKKDMIKTGGENVASLDVEKTIYLDPRVQEVHVIGLPHERWAEAITAFVIPKPGQTIEEKEIIALCKEKMMGFKVPKRVIFLPDLPRSAVGKVLKRKIRDEYMEIYKGER